MERVTTIDGVRDAVEEARRSGRRVALVPTMGALHEGHLALVRTAALEDSAAVDAPQQDEGVADRPFVVVSIFVNPTQFAPGEDFEAYPRDLASDEAALTDLGDAAPDIVYAPSVDEMYPDGAVGGVSGHLATRIRVRGLTERLCGAQRPGHFDGVCTVVAKLLNQVAPDVAYFGRKDHQQLQVIRRMVRDLDLPVAIRGVRTIREPDGLAMSSRNSYLEGDERVAARALSQALAAAVRAAREARGRGQGVPADLLREAVEGRLVAEPLARTDYVEVVDPETLEPPDVVAPGSDPGPDGSRGQELLVAVAAHVGPARLIDNVVVGDPDDEQHLLDAVERGATAAG